MSNQCAIIMPIVGLVWVLSGLYTSSLWAPQTTHPKLTNICCLLGGLSMLLAMCMRESGAPLSEPPAFFEKRSVPNTVPPPTPIPTESEGEWYPND